MDHDEIKNLVAAYALDALDHDERVLVHEHLEAGCSECEILVREMQGVAADLAYAAPSQTPPSELKERIFAQIQAEPVPLSSREERKIGLIEAQLERLRKSRQKWITASWSLGFALIAVAVGLTWYTGQLQEDVLRQKQRLQIGELVIKDLRAELVKKEQILRVIQTPRVRMVQLKGQPPAQSASGTVLWDPAQRKAVIYVANLPQLPSDRDYQLWMLRGDQPIDAGIFQVDSQGASQAISIDTIADTANLSAFAVSLEPKGGVPQQPTGALYLLGVVTSP